MRKFRASFCLSGRILTVASCICLIWTLWTASAAYSEDGKVGGKIVRADGENAEGLEIRLKGIGRNYPIDPQASQAFVSEEKYETETTAGGKFVFESVKPGVYNIEFTPRFCDAGDDYYLEVLHAGRQWREFPEVHVLPGGYRVVPDLFLARVGWQARVTVQLPSTETEALVYRSYPPGNHQPLFDKKLNVEPVKDGKEITLSIPDAWERRGGISSLDWLLAFPDVLVMRVYLAEDKYVVRELTVRPCKKNHFELDISEVHWGDLTGRVFLGGEPATQDVKVFLYKKGSAYPFSPYSAAVVNEKGEFKFASVECGEYEVYALAKDYPHNPTSVTVGNERETCVDLRLDRAKTGAVEISMTLMFEDLEYTRVFDRFRVGDSGQKTKREFAVYLLPKSDKYPRPCLPYGLTFYNGPTSETVAGIPPGEYWALGTTFFRLSPEPHLLTEETAAGSQIPYKHRKATFKHLAEEILPMYPPYEKRQDDMYWHYFLEPVIVETGKMTSLRISRTFSLERMKENCPLSVGIVERVYKSVKEGK